MCQHCYWKTKPKKPLQKATKPISHFSRKQLRNLREYRKIRDKFLKENPNCMFPECESRATDLHQGAGRLGEKLTDVKYFKALCRHHHQIIEKSPEFAKSLGLSYSLLDKEN